MEITGLSGFAGQSLFNITHVNLSGGRYANHANHATRMFK